ncbi:MAG TPA: glycoside hydrolase family 3 C-terminal domain-containing protein [Fimbriimonas sp.]
MLSASMLGFTLVLQQPIYLNPNIDPKTRARDLVARMTLEEKVGQLVNVAEPVERLGVPGYDWWSESLHGAVGSPVTVFPQAIGLAASFDPELVKRVATAISDEGRARFNEARKKGRTGMHEGLTFWAPNINIFRDPRWGRGQETYGEDPFLTSRLAVAYVRAMQDERYGRLKTVATPKHFAVHSGPDRERHRFNAVVEPGDLWNTYLPAFRASVVEGGAWSVMSSYNAINGVPAPAHPFLLQKILRERWGFRGYVVSDCGAVWDVVSGHRFRATRAEGAAASVKAGTDLECGDAYKGLTEAVAQKLISEEEIDQAAQRLFEARIRLSMFDPIEKDPYRHLDRRVVDSPMNRALALEAARKSIVLLKNDGFLPLRNVKTLAVIGPHANDRGIPLGNYNGIPSRTVTILEGIQAIAPKGTQILHAEGAQLTEGLQVVPVPSDVLPEGVKAEFFQGEELSGKPILAKQYPHLALDYGQGPLLDGGPCDAFSARFTATLVPKNTGEYHLGTRADDGTRLWLDGKLIVDDWNVHAAQANTAKVKLEAGRKYSLKLEYFEGSGFASVALVWSPPGREIFGEAIEAARKADAVVITLGISGAIENEENDRESIGLPEVQQRLLDRILASRKPVVVVLESGSCIALEDRKLRGLIQAWYPGEEGGTAVAEVLFGKTNPSGRLPITWYKSLAQVPPFRDYKMAGRTYRYFTGQPQYPFGHGLSYTRFTYGTPTVRRNPDLEIQATVRNTGTRAGDEIVQVYAMRDGAKWPEPVKKLVGIARVQLKPKESKRVTVKVRLDDVAHSDPYGNLKVLPGGYTLSIGGSQPGFDTPTSGRIQYVRASF